MAFTAVVDCPECGDTNIHWLDEPVIATEEEYWRYVDAMETWDPNRPVRVVGDVQIHQWGGFPQPRTPTDERNFEVMRVCRECNHRWGVR